eukprot:359440-Chlamydomonas_euryale.AAC.4
MNSSGFVEEGSIGAIIKQVLLATGPTRKHVTDLILLLHWSTLRGRLDCQRVGKDGCRQQTRGAPSMGHRSFTHHTCACVRPRQRPCQTHCCCAICEQHPLMHRVPKIYMRGSGKHAVESNVNFDKLRSQIQQFRQSNA